MTGSDRECVVVTGSDRECVVVKWQRVCSCEVAESV